MIKDPLLSILTTNRNDLYHDNQLLRTKFILNYFAYSVKKMDATKKIEYVIVDWGSTEPLSNFFKEEISSCPAIKFINIPRKETKKYELTFDYSKAINIGIENCLGEHIMLTGSDAFFPLSVFNNLINLLEKPENYGLKGDEYKLVPRKFLKDDFFIYENNIELVDQYFQSLNHSAMPFPDFPLNGGGGAGGNLLKKSQWLKIGGMKDTKFHNRGQDMVNLHETSKFCSHIDIATFGSFLFKLPRTEKGFRKKQVINKNELDFISFEKSENTINPKNIEIISNLNIPKKTKKIIHQSSFKINDVFSFKEKIDAIIDCGSLSDYLGVKLSVQDINFILKMKNAIKENKLKTIIFDEKQANRFMIFLAKRIPDLKFIVFTNAKKKPIDTLKYRALLTRIINKKKPRHFSNIKVINFNEQVLKTLEIPENVCIIEDELGENLQLLKNQFTQAKIKTLRTVVDNKIHKIKYNCNNKELFKFNDYNFNKSYYLIKFFIYMSKSMRKIKRALGY